MLSKAVSRWKGIAVYSPIINGKPASTNVWLLTVLKVSGGGEMHLRNKSFSSPSSSSSSHSH